MNRIIKLSDNGFQLDTGMEFIGPKWFTCDKYKIFKVPKMKALFQSLEVGDELSDIKLNDKDFVIDFKVSNSQILTGNMSGRNAGTKISSLDKADLKNVSEGGSKVPTPSDTLIQSGKHILERSEGYPLKTQINVNSEIKSSSVQDSIRYAQCVNLAFNDLAVKGLNIDFQKEDGSYPNINKAFDNADLIYSKYVKRLK